MLKPQKDSSPPGKAKGKKAMRSSGFLEIQVHLQKLGGYLFKTSKVLNKFLYS